MVLVLRQLGVHAQGVWEIAAEIEHQQSLLALAIPAVTDPSTRQTVPRSSHQVSRLVTVEQEAWNGDTSASTHGSVCSGAVRDRHPTYVKERR